MQHILVLCAIVLSIAMGYMLNLNIGLLAIAFSYILGTFVFGMKTGAVIGLWPTSTFFVFISVSIFFGISGTNGTLKKLAEKLIYAFRRTPSLIPYALFLASWLMAGLGVSVLGTMAFMAPITLALADQIKMDKFTAAMAMIMGCLGGADFVTGGNGIIFMGLLENLGFDGTSVCLVISAVATVFFLLVLTGYLFISRGFQKLRNNATEIQQPEPMTPEQRGNIGLIIVFMILCLGAPLLKTIFGGVFTTINSKMHVGLIAIILTIVGLIMKLADQKKVINNVPWATVLMLCGVGMLVQLAVVIGTVQVVGQWLGTSLPRVLVPAAASLIASFMSFFSSAGAVVCPALYPMVPTLTAATGIKDIILFALITIGAQATAISPFSTCGSVTIASTQNDEDRDYLFKALIYKGVFGIAIAAAVFAVIVGLIFVE
ncbi:MAG: hypothetical protein IJ702_05495 [Fretibacterium sp.]|nr:hypothetical protein [Fretibacterium sp.]